MDEARGVGWAATGAAILIWAVTLGWFGRMNYRSARWRFTTRTLLIATTLVAVVLAARGSKSFLRSVVYAAAAENSERVARFESS